MSVYIFLNSIEFEWIRDFLWKLKRPLSTALILKDFHRKSTVTNNIVYGRNYWFFNDNEFKNDLKSISWENTLSQINLSAISVFGLFFKQINTLLDEHASVYKLSKKSYHLRRRSLGSAKAFNHLWKNATDLSSATARTQTLQLS